MDQKKSIMDRGIAIWSSMDPAWKFSLIAVTLMRVFYTLWSLVLLSSFSLVVQNQEFFGEPVLAVFDLQTSRSYAYDRFVDGDLLTLQNFDGAHLTDAETGSIWRISNGESVSGAYEGKLLSPADITTERLFPYHGALLYAAWAVWKHGRNKVAWRMYKWSSTYLVFIFLAIMIDAVL